MRSRCRSPLLDDRQPKAEHWDIVRWSLLRVSYQMEIDLTRPDKLYRYSEMQWLRRSLQLGEFRLRPASEYTDMEEATARTDNERHRKIVLRNPTITNVSTGQPIIPLGDVVMHTDTNTDYLTLCFATLYSDHFYHDFVGSDACLVIHEPNEFFNRFYKALEDVIPRSWGAADSAVSYGAKSKLGAAFTKDERFLFQFEWRFACIPPVQVEKCSAVMVSIGNIEDIAEIVVKSK